MKTSKITTAVNGKVIDSSSRKPTAAFAAKYKRDRMRKKHEKDMIQRWEGDRPSKEFARAYPEQAAKEFGEDFVRNAWALQTLTTHAIILLLFH